MCIRDSSAAYDTFIAALTIDLSTQVITDVAGADNTFTAFRYELKAGPGNSFIETPEFSEEGGAAYNQELQISLLGFDAVTRRELHRMVTQRKLVIIVRDFQNNLVVMGYDNGAEVSAGTIDRGIQMSDFYGRKLTFSAKTTKPACFMSPYAATPLDNFDAILVSPAYGD